MKHNTYRDIESLLNDRKSAKESGNFEKYDALSSQIDALCIGVTDTKQGARWKLRANS